MKLYKYLMLPVLAALTFTACEEEENGPSKAIIPGYSEIVLPAAATSQNVTIYADGTWIADVTDTWLSIDPTSGTGTMDVVLTADANVTDLAREAKIIVKGASTLNDIEITVTQKMDRFRETSACSVTEAVALKEGNLAKLSECQVMATTKGGFVVSDGKSNIFVQGTASVKAGDKLTLTGDVVAFNGLTAIKLEDAFVASSSEVSYSSAKEVDLSEAYAPGKVELLSATLSYNSGGDLSIDGKKVAAVYNPTSEQNEMAFHKVKITGYYLGTIKDVPAILPVIIEDIEMEAIPYLQFEIETAEFKNANPNFGTNHKFNAKVGGGYIEYVPDDLASSDPDGVWKMDLSGNDPRCTGPWPGDYWDIVGASPVKANSEFKIQFGSRVSATGHKYWMLEYLDGTVWKPVGQTKESTDMPDGENVEYTHAMNKDGGTNIIVDETFSITKNMDNLHVRFRCVTNWQANGKGPLAKRNTGSARLAISSDGSKGDASVVAPQPSILITKMGDGAATVDPEPEYANIELSTNLITFEGTPDAPKSLKVTSDRDFTLKSTVSWLSLSEEGGVADNQTEILVTCEPSELTTLRQGKIIIKSGDSQAEVNVVQSAAGQILEPFISIVGGNELTVKGEAAEKTVTIQANVPYEIEVVEGAEWIAAAKVETKALVEMTDIVLTISENKRSDPRTGAVRVYNEANKLSAYLTVVQEQSTVILARWFLDTTTMDGYKDTFGTTAGTLDKVAGDGGQYIEANDGGSGRITYVQVDKTGIDVDNKSGRWTGGTGEPYVVGAWKGDYWLITAHYEKGIPAGANIHGFFSTRTSGSGLKYWLAEYLDGTEWKPLMETKKVTSGGAEVEYNIAHANTANFKVEFSYKAVNASKDVKIRVTAVALDQANGGAALAKPNGGTIRIKGNDGLSPYIEMNL